MLIEQLYGQLEEVCKKITFTQIFNESHDDVLAVRNIEISKNYARDAYDLAQRIIQRADALIRRFQTSVQEQIKDGILRAYYAQAEKAIYIALQAYKKVLSIPGYREQAEKLIIMIQKVINALSNSADGVCKSAHLFPFKNFLGHVVNKNTCNIRYFLRSLDKGFRYYTTSRGASTIV